MLVFEKLDDGFQLFPVLVGRGNSRVSRRETVGVNLAIDVSHILGVNQRHMAISALLRLFGIIKGARSLAGNATGLPVIVVVETPQPAILVHWNVQMDLVTGRTQLGCVLAMEGLHEDFLVRFGIHLDQEIVLLLVARSCKGGYSITNPPLPMLSFTLTMEWHEVQARPA